MKMLFCAQRAIYSLETITYYLDVFIEKGTSIFSVCELVGHGFVYTWETNE